MGFLFLYLGTGEEYIKTRMSESYGAKWQYKSQLQQDVWLTSLVIPRLET